MSVPGTTLHALHVSLILLATLVRQGQVFSQTTALMYQKTGNGPKVIE